jgi:hypothetical protein
MSVLAHNNQEYLVMKLLVLGLALASSALAAPAFASASLDTTHSSNIETVAKADLKSIATSLDITDQAAPLNANVDQRYAAASLDMTASYSFGNDFVYVPPAVLFDRQATSFITANAAPMVHYAVLIKVDATTDLFGVELDPATRAKRIV